MVSFDEAYTMIRITWNLGSANILASLASNLVPPLQINAKGKAGILQYLEVIPAISQQIVKKYDSISKIIEESSQWINLLEKEYGDPGKYGLQTKPMNLTRKHAEQLALDIGKWFEKIYTVYEKPQAKLFDGNELTQQTIELSNKLDGNDKKDLIDAYKCLISNIPTPGAMMLYRVAESMVRKYYVYEMNFDPPEGSTMGSMANEIRKKQAKEIEEKKRSKPDSLLNYILSQIDDRNLAQHPERRFDQTEAEEIFILVKKLIIDVHKKLEE